MGCRYLSISDLSPVREVDSDTAAIDWLSAEFRELGKGQELKFLGIFALEGKVLVGVPFLPDGR